MVMVVTRGCPRNGRKINALHDCCCHLITYHRRLNHVGDGWVDGKNRHYPHRYSFIRAQRKIGDIMGKRRLR